MAQGGQLNGGQNTITTQPMGSGKDVAGSDGEPFTRLPWVTQPVAELALTTLLHASVTADGMMDTGLAGTVFALTSSAVATAGAALAAHKPCVTSSA